jgi:uncharacterized protein
MASLFGNSSPARRIGRRALFGAPLVLAAAAAHSQPKDDSQITYEHSSLVIVTGSREIKFDVELALTDAQREHGLMFRDKLGPYEGCCSTSIASSRWCSG